MSDQPKPGSTEEMRKWIDIVDRSKEDRDGGKDFPHFPTEDSSAFELGDTADNRQPKP